MGSKDRHDCQRNPERRLEIKREPEEPIVRWTDDLDRRIRGLKDPVRIACLRVDLVPPPEAHEAPAGDILEVVEIDREEEDGDDEDQDADGRLLACPLVPSSPENNCRTGEGKE